MEQNGVNVAIIGTGISGLRTAYLLSKRTDQKLKNITLFERNDYLGGVIRNTKKNGYLLEHGAQGVLLSRETFKTCIDDLKLNHKLLFPPTKKLKRFLLTPSEIIALSPNLFKFKRKGLIRIRDILRIIFEIFIRKPVIQNPNESLYSFFSRRFGKAFASTFLVPLSFGIWGGSSRKLLIRYTFPQLLKLENGYGSLFRAAFYTFFKKLFYKKEKIVLGLASFPEGMHCLIDNLHKELKENCSRNNIQLNLKLTASVREINKDKNKLELKYQILNEDNVIREDYDCVIYTGQPWRDSHISIASTFPEINNPFQTLRNIESHSIAVIGLGGKDTEKRAPQGFGALAGEWSNDILGIIFIHSTYPSHTPENSFLYRVMLGGDRDLDINLLSDEELLELSKKRLREAKIISDKTKFEFTEVVKWEKYLPLSTELQDKVIQSVWQLEALMPGLFFAGNYIKGPAVPDCLAQANETAEKVIKYINELI
ncbi:protoporphyrinogen oxidase [Fluviispira multicolorata]|uniref:Coproporphyrinogen III oxidase n=1 Tax=Fluviispira multicolorata TaxID=2654512 RepID=A0A833JF36_9BACT|nr:protoporphyrinogen oxidase [Fluviispira multicolorata]KAB8033526.1 protoporphyrinogen oxidase [Fluviispira multicolorata]